MGDDSSFRYRRDDGYPGQPAGSRSPQAAAAPSAEDALAELARLIGQDDPFADFGDIAEEPAPAPARPAREAAARPQFSAPPVERRFEDWQPGRRTGREAATDPRDAVPAREPTTMRERTVARETPSREATGVRQSPGFGGGQAPAMPPRAPLPAPPAVSGRDAAFPPRESTAGGGLRGRAPDPNDWGASEATGWGATESAAAQTQPDGRSTVRSGYGSLARRGEAQPGEAPRAPAARHEQEPGRDPSRDDGAYAYADSEQTRYADYDDTYDPAFDEEGYMPPHSEEVYETEPRRNRGRTALIAVAALVGLGVVATAGVMVFRGGGSGSSSSTAETAPVIKADTTPSKVAGPTPANGQGGEGQKLIYDRVGGQPGQEKVVPREEQPMDVAAAAAAAAAAGAAQQPASPTDPKRVKTVAVRSDGSIVPGAAPPAAAAPVNGVAPTAYAPTQNPIPTGAPAPKTVTTTTTSGQGVPVAAVPAAPAAAAAAAPPAAAANGAYVVQVSSQKSEADALGSFKVLQTRYPQLLGSYKASVRRADLGDKGVFYRALVGPFASRDEANTLCNALQAQGGTCFVTRN
ncbi:MAG: SPOR domain-containing protein [Pseudomonadota bacterium]